MGATRVTLALLIGAGLSLSEGAAGQEEVRRVSMAEAIELFGENSLALRIARAESRQSAGMARQSRAYPNPAFTLVREDLGRSGEDYWETTVGVAQPVEWPGRTAARARAASQAIDAAAARFQADSLRLAFDVREAYARAWRAEATERTVGDAAVVIRVVAEAAERRLAAGDISLFETRRLRVERVRIEQDLLAAGLEARAARRRLATLVAPEQGTPEVGPADELDGTPPPRSRAEALAALPTRPDLEAAARSLDAARAQTAVAGAAWVPDPTLSLGYKDQADGFSGVSFGVTLPMPLFDRGGGGRDAASAREASAAATLALRRREAETDLLVTADRYEAARRQLVGVGDALLADAEGLLEAARAAWAEGELTLLELLDAASAYRGARVSAIALRSETWIAYYDLLRAMGRSPEEDR